ncbi:hypothetical protein HAX54_003194 [Datura stramonium]|uniref:Uncharacterized protein n=1 Tax=Datura stramonium TaxID=4076 RepID=A0ABS8T681_DATST|nr:hypothetical protein [Datura stramonium]
MEGKIVGYVDGTEKTGTLTTSQIEILRNISNNFEDEELTLVDKVYMIKKKGIKEKSNKGKLIVKKCISKNATETPLFICRTRSKEKIILEKALEESKMRKIEGITTYGLRKQMKRL